MQTENQRNEETVGNENTPITVGPITVDVSHLQVSVDGKMLSLTGVEGYILNFLAIRANTVCTFNQISSHIWGSNNNNYGDSSLRRIAIRHIRQKIEPDPMYPTYLLSIPEVGYTFVSHEYE